MLITAVAAIVLTASCNDFLKEEAKTFLSPDTYFTTEAQMTAAVDGLYTYLDDILSGDIEVGTQRIIFLEYLTGYGERERAATALALDQAVLLTVKEDNNNLQELWQSAYVAINNTNAAIAGIEASKADVAEATKNNLLGQAYFMRAYHYFNLVRMWGEVPYKTEPTKDLADVKIPLTPQKDIYDGIVADLVKAEELIGNTWNSADGHVALAAVKSLLAKVYITMAGYPLQLGTEYYSLAYTKAKEVKDGAGISLYGSYADMRDAKFACGGEIILTIEREKDNAGSPVHNVMLPYPEVLNVSANSAYGGGLVPTLQFYQSYAEGDARTADFGYYTKKYKALDGSADIEVAAPHIYKYWDTEAAELSKSGANYPLIRYADVLLLMAEAKAVADGGSTTDAAAIDAYYQVRKRAMPAEAKPASLDFATVYKERTWELCFETQTWFDMLRTRKALNVTNGNVVDLIGFQTPGHTTSAFKESDLLFPYPLREVRLNPNLKR